MNNNQPISRLHQFLYYFILFLSGFIIYQFQIEKSFNLLSVYTTVLLFICIRPFSEKYAKSLLPLFFLAVLFYLYPGMKFLYIISALAILLGIIIPTYNFRIKISLLLVAGFILSFIYVFPNTAFEQIRYVPFLMGSLFMFRSISFIHEMRFTKKEISTIDKINYFLLLPNLSMPLFPIVDFKDFVASYAAPNFRQLRRGTLFICRGIIQLLVYRFIYHYIVSPISGVENIADVALYVTSNFLIVLRVIGAFHICIGLITLCGYSIPDLFNNIFFAHGFSDLWRRTNIYWKEFITKIFYFPLYFNLKKRGEYVAITISTLICFAITWFLHNYQWFWIKGSFPVQIKDLIFWGIFGILVTMSSLWQQRKLVHKESHKQEVKNSQLIQLSLGSLLVFVSMSILWSIWIAPDLHAWIQLLAHAKNISVRSIGLVGCWIVAYLIVVYMYHSYQKNKNTRYKYIATHLESISIYPYLAVIIALLLAQVFSQKKIQYGLLLKPIITEKLNKADQENVDNGYYTNLISTNDYCTQVWSSDLNKDKKRTKYINQNITLMTNDMMLCKYIPNKKIAVDNIIYSINSAGFHDIEYAQNKPLNTYRIIVLGGSYESGNGVNDNEDFITLVENNLNKNYRIEKNGQPVKVEIINMAINGYMLLQRVYQYKKYATLYEADAALLFLHSNYNQRMINYVARLLYNNNSVEDPYLSAIIKNKQLKKSDTEATLKSKMGFAPDSLNAYSLRSLATMSKQDSILLVGVFLPAVKDPINSSDLQNFMQLSKQYQFPLLNLENVYGDKKKKDLSISEIDFHPNKVGNDLIAKKLEETIILQQDIFNLSITKK
ncbi:MAG: hypothetical protein WCP57_00265 [Bacteroidota bacterium]